MPRITTSRKEEGAMSRSGRCAKVCVVLMILLLISAVARWSGASAAPVLDLGGYTGPDAQYIIKQIPEPVLKPGYKFKAGYLQVFSGINVMMTLQNECEKKVRALGGTFISYDAGLDIQKQVSQMDQLISQKVDVIIAYPTTDVALTQGVAAAKAAGIPVVQVNVPSNSQKTLDPNVAAMVGMAFDQYDYVTIKYIAEKFPKGKVAFLGYGPPTDNLVHIIGRAKYWAQQMGLNILGEVPAMDASPNAATVATQAIIGKYPDVQIIIGYNDYATMAAAATLKAAGKTGVLVATMNGGQDITAAGIKEGTALCAYRNAWWKVGNAAAIAAYDVLTKQPLPARRMLFIGELATKENVDSLTFVH